MKNEAAYSCLFSESREISEQKILKLQFVHNMNNIFSIVTKPLQTCLTASLLENLLIKS